MHVISVAIFNHVFVDSLLIPLRCQVHTELAKCEEDQEQIQVAMDNLKKVLEPCSFFDITRLFYSPLIEIHSFHFFENGWIQNLK